MWAMIVKEFRQLRRDRRTLAMMIALPVVLLVIFGYAASFDVSSIPAAAAGPGSSALVGKLGKPFEVTASQPGEGKSWAEQQLRDGNVAVAVVTSASGKPQVLLDGTQLFTARAALEALASAQEKQATTFAHALAGLRGAAGATAVGGSGSAAYGSSVTVAPTAPFAVSVLYNPDLTTSAIMIPGLAGVILVFIGTIITSLGVVRERQTGTLEQLAVMPIRPRDVFLGKIVPYFAVAAVDLAIVIGVGVAIFNVPFRGSYATFVLGALLFLFVTLGIGVLISSVSENQGQAMQMSMMVMLPQVLLSGLIFPLSSIAAGVRWISYILPLTYFNEISRGVMLRAEPIGSLWEPLVVLAGMGTVVVTLAIFRFRSYLAPASPRGGKGSPVATPAAPAPQAAGGGA